MSGEKIEAKIDLDVQMAINTSMDLLKKEYPGVFENSPKVSSPVGLTVKDQLRAEQEWREALKASIRWSIWITDEKKLSTDN